MEPVIIVGSGIAGLYCAYKLLKNKIPVIIFEKDEQLGGRMYTEEIHPTKNQTLLIEGGAGVIRSDEDEIINLCNDLKVEMNYWKSTTTIVYNDGDKSVILDLNYPKILEQVCPQANSTKTFQTIVETSSISPEEKLGLLIGTTYSELFYANSEHVCDENDFYEFMINSSKYKYGKPKNGWKALVQALKEQITKYKGAIYVNSPVVQIGNNYVIVKLNKKEKTIIRFQNLIVTTPLHFVEEIKMTESLNQWYQIANQMIQETNYLRVYSYFEKPFIFDGKIATNLPIRRVISITDNLIMTAYTDGQDANMIYKLSKDDKKLSEYLTEQLQILFQTKIPKIKKNWAIFWDKGIASWKPSKCPVEDALPYIQHPLPNIYFCGDTYSLYPGWITGAMESSDNVLNLMGIS
jgi:monoamine oxidase